MDKIELQNEIRTILNRASRENASDTPDFILAEYLLGSLEAFEVAARRRDAWYGIAPRPGWRTDSGNAKVESSDLR
jgi:hypothetical protein